jgi:hypothetical protein
MKVHTENGLSVNLADKPNSFTFIEEKLIKLGD